jgi:23S rRNA pseudouridine2605 synthase
VASRRKAGEMISQKRVRVDQEVISEPGYRIDPDTDPVFLDGKPVKPPNHFRTVLLNKPSGVLTTVRDDRDRKTVIDLIPLTERLFPVGRLDLDTTGVLLLTNDGDLAYRLTHPKYEIEKVYEAWVEGLVDEKIGEKFKEGIAIDPGVIVSGEVRILKKERNRSKLEIRIHEGKKRQIKRMSQAVGHRVISLERVNFAGLISEGLKPGEWRELTSEEVERLYALTGLWVKGKRETGNGE